MMRYKIFSFLFIAIALSGCSHKKLDTNLQRLNDQHIDVAIHYLGIPDDKFTIDDREVYIWGRENSETIDRPITTYGGYNSGGGAFGGVGVVFGAPYSRSRNRYYCKIKVITNKDQIIERIERDSTTGACAKYNEAVDNIEKDNLTGTFPSN